MNEQELQEQLEAARAEIETLQEAIADREARAAQQREQLEALQGELTSARAEAEARAQELALQAERASALETEARGAAERYRAAVLEREPELPDDLIGGETVAEIDASVERARQTVSKVRGHLESQAAAGRVPVGAPPRGEPDLSGLSTAEKIRHGLGTRG